MAVTSVFYNVFLRDLGNGTHDMDTHTFKAMLLQNTYVFNAAHSVLADVSAFEIAAGNGYTAGGETLLGVTYVLTGAVVKFDANDVIWTAGPAAMATSKFVVIYNDSVVAPLKPLLGVVDMDGNKTPAAGDSLTIQWDAANGIFRIV
jgi:hypothetical protein